MLRNLVSDINGGTQTESVGEQSAGEKMRLQHNEDLRNL
jgi:hypothetical protein